MMLASPISLRAKGLRAVATVLGAMAMLLMIVAAPARAGSRIELNDGWRFRIDAKDEGVSAGWTSQLPPGTRPIEVPHTWNVGQDVDFEGTGWYFRKIELPTGLKPDAHVELHFGATFYNARIWLNGVEVGSHEGGHTAYWFDITPLLHAGSANYLAVAIDNRPSVHSIPGYAMRLAGSKNVQYDWWHYGGLVRTVWLNVADGGLIRNQTLDGVLVGVLPTSTSQRLDAQVSTRVDIENPTRTAQVYAVKTVAYDPHGGIAATAEGRAQVPAGGHRSVTLQLTIARPILWNVGDGQLYDVVSELHNPAGKTLDSRSDSLGLRRIELRQRQLWVNGAQVRLTGLTRHEDSPWEGLAETRGTILHDWDDLSALHTTLTRPVHYPQPPEVLAYADRHGILLVPEIPIWQFTEAQLRDPRVLALAQRMMTEMIGADGNHPSILGWSVCNESDTRLPGGLAYVRTMKALIDRIDPRRFVTFADADLSIPPWPDSPAAHEVDFIMANAYFGSWSGSSEQVEPWLDFMGRTYPDKMLIVSEYGYPGPFSRNPIEADRQRVANMRQQLDAFAKRDFVGGAIFWTYQDYKSPRNLWAGETQGYVEHGVVDENRQRKPSYFAYRDRTVPLTAELAWVHSDQGLTGFKAVLQRNAITQIPSYPLAGYRAEWRMLDRDGVHLGEGSQALSDLDTPFTLNGAWPVAENLKEATLRLRVIGPDGTQVLERELPYNTLRFGASPYPGNGEASLPSATPR
jgi:beta-glucuronidase